MFNSSLNKDVSTVSAATNSLPIFIPTSKEKAGTSGSKEFTTSVEIGEGRSSTEITGSSFCYIHTRRKSSWITSPFIE